MQLGAEEALLERLVKADSILTFKEMGYNLEKGTCFKDKDDEQDWDSLDSSESSKLG